jgi:hypothetical protein
MTDSWAWEDSFGAGGGQTDCMVYKSGNVYATWTPYWSYDSSMWVKMDHTGTVHWTISTETWSWSGLSYYHTNTDELWIAGYHTEPNSLGFI